MDKIKLKYNRTKTLIIVYDKSFSKKHYKKGIAAQYNLISGYLTLYRRVRQRALNKRHIYIGKISQFLGYKVEFKEKPNYPKRPKPYKDYKDYLSSPAWHKKRTQIFIRSGKICEICKTNKAEEVHHKTYKHIYKEPLEDLIAVCQTCHRAEHNLLTSEETEIEVNRRIEKDLGYI